MLIRTFLVMSPLLLGCAATGSLDGTNCCRPGAECANEQDVECPSLEVVYLQYAYAPEVASTIEELIRSGRKSARGEAPKVKVLADRRTNSLLVSAPQEEIGKIMDLAARLDVEVPSSEASE